MVDGCPDSKPVTYDWELKTYKTQNMVNSKIRDLKPGITTAERSLYDAEFSSSKAQKELESAWAWLWEAKKRLNNSEVTQKEGEGLISSLKFEDAYYKFQYSYKEAEKIDDYLFKITEHLDKAESFESAYREGSTQKAESSNEQTCFLFWCW